MDKEGKRVMIRREFLNKERTMKGIRSILSVIGVVGLFSLFLFNHSALSQQPPQQEGKVVQPKHLVYETVIDGVQTDYLSPLSCKNQKGRGRSPL
ncbi:MAG: hypothetical protein JRF64_11855 [Deltaproteobacteria bacterium]|nr:hypothetical protein [Deltaproteobacteria bacterium]